MKYDDYQIKIGKKKLIRICILLIKQCKEDE